MAAAMHAEAALACRATTLVGVGGRRGTGTALSEAAGVPVLELETMVEASDALVIATPPAAVSDVVEVVADRVAALLVESPVPPALPSPGTPTMIGANLLHAAFVRKGLTEIGRMNPHHLQLRCTMPRPVWGSHAGDGYGGPLFDPGARLLSLLLAAAGSSVVSADLDRSRPNATSLDLHLNDGRTVGMRSTWLDGSATVELEAADATGVVQISMFPTPSVEVNGQPSERDTDPPVVALGFVNQIERLARVAQGEAEPWLPLSSGQGIRSLLDEVSD